MYKYSDFSLYFTRTSQEHTRKHANRVIKIYNFHIKVFGIVFKEMQKGRVSVVGAVTQLCSGRPWKGGSIPGGGKRFLPSPKLGDR
jgi:hypothetical protein